MGVKKSLDFVLLLVNTDSKITGEEGVERLLVLLWALLLHGEANACRDEGRHAALRLREAYRRQIRRRVALQHRRRRRRSLRRISPSLRRIPRRC